MKWDGYNREEFHMQDPVYWDDAYPIALLLRETHPDVHITTAAIDRQLDDTGYIRPGLGDAGDRIFGTDR